MGEEDGSGERRDRTGEYARFFVVLIVLGGTLVMMALLRPIIFERIVPAVLGMNAAARPTAAPTVEPTAIPAEPTAAPQPTEASLTPATPEATAAAEATATVTAEPAATTAVVTYIVQPGDTLVRIAERYGVTVEAIMVANGLTNPHLIQVEMVLIIPEA